jgi:hypothetical protein
MKQAGSFLNRWRNINSTVARFPLTVIFLLATTINNAAAIIMNNYDSYIKVTTSLGIGALVSVVCQLLYERFISKKMYRYLLMLSAIVLTIIYYLIIKNEIYDVELAVRTTVIIFILTVLLIWIPSIKSRINFNQSFVVVFKSFFMALFLNGILFLGVVIIIAAINLLLFSIDTEAYLHSANIIFVLFAPVTFLLYIPIYPAFINLNSSDNKTGDSNETNKEEISHAINSFNKNDNDEKLSKAIASGKLLETLVSYIIIPVAAVFTLILVLYILINITGKFWTDNLLESMLVAYSITVIFLYLLASNIENLWTKYFRKIFPKVLVIVVLFQTISSLLKINELGITSGRYYVILFGVFSIIAGIIFCIIPKEKNGAIAPILIALSLISIIPGIDAFTVSRASQINRLKTVLENNNMLKGDVITPKKDISDEDKKKIIASFTYLSRMNYTDSVSWLSGYKEHYNFEEIFGFSMYEDVNRPYKYITINREHNASIALDGYDFLTVMDIYNYSQEAEPISFTKDGREYLVRVVKDQANEMSIVLEHQQAEIAGFPISDVFDRFSDYTDYELKKNDEVTFFADNQQAAIKIIVDYISFNALDKFEGFNGLFYVFIKIK